MKKTILGAVCLILLSTVTFAQTDYYSDGSYSQTSTNQDGSSTTYNSDGSYSQTTPNSSGGSTTYNSDGSYSQSTP